MQPEGGDGCAHRRAGGAAGEPAAGQGPARQGQPRPQRKDEIFVSGIIAQTEPEPAENGIFVFVPRLRSPQFKMTPVTLEKL